MSVPGVIWTESEFDGQNATCGPNSLAMAECWADQTYRGVAKAGQTATTQVYRRMRAARRCDPNGASTGGGLYAQARADGFRAVRHSGGGWLTFTKASLAAPAVVVTELAAAHNLRDHLTGKGEDAGPTLAYHYICLCDYHPGGFSKRAGRDLPEGFFAADGDSDVTNPIIGGHRHRLIAGHTLVFYTVPTLAAARPCDLVAVYPRVRFSPSAHAPAPAPTPTPAKPAPVLHPAPAPKPAPVPTQPTQPTQPATIGKVSQSMNLFAAAAAGLSLTPSQRAFLKLLEGCFMAALVTVLPIVAQLLGGANPDWASIGRLALAAFGTAFLLALAKYYKAHGDAPLGDVLDTAAGDLRQFGGVPNDVKIEPEVPQEPSSSDGASDVPPTTPAPAEAATAPAVAA